MRETLIGVLSFVLLSELWLLPSVFGQGRYMFTTEKTLISYQDPEFVDISTGVFVNQRNLVAFNSTFTMKIELPIETKMNVKGYRILNNGYEMQFMQFDKYLKDLLEMENFDLQGMFVRFARPPVVWPIQKGVTYRLSGWVPDASKFPSTMPTGNWLFKLTELLPNRTKTFTAEWYFKILPKAH